MKRARRYTTIQLNTIHTGDCLEILKTLPEDSVHCCVTSPPYYALRDYGMDAQIGRETTPKEYISRLTEVFTEVRRVLRPDGTLWLNISDTYAGKGNQGDFVDPKNPNGRNGQAVALNNKVEGCKPKDMIGIPWMLAFALRDTGWYLRNDIIWMKDNPMPESVKDRCARCYEHIFLFSKSKNTFFIVIDYDAPINEDEEQYQTYFLNMVDESDLLALLDEDTAAALTTCNCKEKCAAGQVNTDCPVCKTNMSECTGTAPVTPEPDKDAETDVPAPKPEKKSNIGMILVIFALAGAAGAAYYYIKFVKADADAFLKGIVRMTGDLVKAYPFLSDAEAQRFGTGKEEIGKCPRCGSPVYVGKGNFYCSNKACSFCLWEDNKFFSSKKKKLTKRIVKELLDKGWCRVTGLYTPKKPQLYDAVIRLDDSGGKYVSFKMEFDK